MKVRFGIIGCGSIHGTHADAIKKIENAELTAFYDVVPGKASDAAAKYGCKACSSLEELFDSVDAVNICVPSGDHAGIGVAAAKAGKHVLTEKPIEVTLAAATALIKACREAGVKLGVISQHRFSDGIRTVHDQVQAGYFGRMLAGDAYIKWHRTQAYYDSGDWRGTWKLDGGGCLMNQGVHYIDMAQWVMGGVKTVRAMTRTMAHERIEVEDIANVLLEYNSGAIGVLQGSTSFYPGFGERLEVHGTHGSAIVEQDMVRFSKVDEEAAQQGLYGGGVLAQPAPNVAVPDVDPSANYAWGDLHQRQIEDFTNAILEDREPLIRGEDAIEPLKVILAIYQSAKCEGAPVHIKNL